MNRTNLLSALGIWSIAALVCFLFLALSGINLPEKAPFRDMMEGTAYQPYINRVLVPWIVRASTILIPEAVQTLLTQAGEQTPLASVLEWVAVPSTYATEFVVISIIWYLCLAGFAFTVRALAKELYKNASNSLNVPIIALLSLCLFFQYGYLYDLPALYLWSLLFLALAREQWKLFLLISALAALNKETALLIPLLWTLYAFNHRQKLPYWSLLGWQMLIILPIWLGLRYIYRLNPGGMLEFNWQVHLDTYSANPWPILIMSALPILLIGISWRTVPHLLRCAVFLLLPLSGLYLLFGWPYEFRVFYEVYPAIILVALYGLQKLTSAMSQQMAVHEEQAMIEQFKAPSSKHVRWLLLLIILIAAALRLWQLDTLPPGLFFDEAFNGLDARAVAEGQQYPFYFAANNGREPAYIYIQALLVGLLGSIAYVLRLASAFIGIITIPIFYITTRKLLSTLTNRDVEWLALIATSAVALSFWHVSLSRLGFRAILLPPVSALAVYFFWRAWIEQRTRCYLLAGMWSACTLYTYVAARLLPIIMLLFILSEWLFSVREIGQERIINRQRIVGLAKMSIIGCICLLPLFYTFYQNPALISARTADVSIFTADFNAMPATHRERLHINLIAMFLNFYTEGDLNLRHNLPGRPAHNFLLATLFTAGWLTALWRIRERLFRLMLIGLAVMALPSLLSTGAPHTLRNVGMVLPLALFYAVGAYQIMRLLNLVVRSRRNLTHISLFFAVALVTGGLTSRDYFMHWANQDQLGQFFDTDLYAGALAVGVEDANHSTVITRRLYLSPQMRFVTGTRLRYDLPNGASIPMSALNQVHYIVEKGADPRQSAFLLWQREGQPVATWLEAPYTAQDGYLLETWQADGMVAFQQGHKKWPSIRIGQLEKPPLQSHRIHYPLNVTFANGMTLIGYDMWPDFIEYSAPRTGFLLTTYWRLEPAAHLSAPLVEISNVQMFTHFILGAKKTQNNGAIGNGYPIVLWQPGEIIEDRRPLYRHLDTPPVKGYVEAGLFTQDNMGKYHRVDILDGLGNLAADQITFGAIGVGMEPAQADLEDFQPLSIYFDQHIELVGWQARKVVDAPTHLQVELGWHVHDRVTTDYTAFVHLINAAGEIIGQHDRSPGGPENPTTMWLPGETIRTTFEIPLHGETELHKENQLRIGLYEPVGGRQLPVTDASNGRNGQIEIGSTYLLISLEPNLSK